MTVLTQAQLRANSSPPAWFFFMETATPVRLWSGVGDYALPADSIDTDGGTYKGLGLFVSVPSITIPLNGAMKRHDFQLAGISSNVLRLANADRATVRGSKVHFGLTMLGPDMQPLADVSWLWDAIADNVSIARQSSNPPTRTVSLSCGTGETARRQKTLKRWTAIDQRARSSDDAFCDRVNLYTSETTEKWPS